MQNPILIARERKHIAQRDLAKLVGVSQQFIQRHEVGAAASLPASLSDFWNSTYVKRDRLDILADLLTEVPSTIKIPSHYLPSNDNHADKFGNLYKAYVHLERKQLPNLVDLTTSCSTRGELFETLKFALDTDSTYNLACKLHVHPFTLSILFEPTHFNLTKPLSLGLPIPFVVAINESGTHYDRV